MSKLKFCVLLLFSFMFIEPVLSQSVRLELCTDTDCYRYNDKIVLDKNESIMLKVEIIPLQDKYLCWNGFHYRFDLIPDKSPDKKIFFQNGIYSSYNWQNPNQICFPHQKSESNIFYIPLDDYSRILPTDRIGTWRLSSFELTFNNLEYYSLIDQKSYTNLQQNSVFDGNEIPFSVETDPPTKGMDFGNTFTLIFKILSFGATILFGYSIYESIKSRKQRKKWIIILIISLISLFIFGKLGFF